MRRSRTYSFDQTTIQIRIEKKLRVTEFSYVQNFQAEAPTEMESRDQSVLNSTHPQQYTNLDQPQAHHHQAKTALTELKEIMKSNKSQEEVMKILLSNPRLMATYIKTKSKYSFNQL